MKKKIMGISFIVALIGVVGVVLYNRYIVKDRPKVEYSYKELELSPEFTSVFKNMKSDSVVLMGVFDDELVYSIVDKTNGYIHTTKALCSYNINTSKVTLLKELDNTKYVFDTYLDNETLYYSTYFIEEDKSKFEVMVNKNGTDTLLDSGEALDIGRTPAFFKDSSLKYLKVETNINEQNDMKASLISVGEDFSLDTVWQSVTPYHYIPQPDGNEYLQGVYTSSRSQVVFSTTTNDRSTVYYMKDNQLEKINNFQPIKSVIVLKNQLIMNDGIYYHFETKEIIEKEDLLSRKVSQYASFNNDTLVYQGNDYLLHFIQYQNETYTEVTLPNLYKDKAVLYPVDDHRILVCYPYNEGGQLFIVTKTETK